MRWRCAYSDGTFLDSPTTGWETTLIDRTRLRGFDVFHTGAQYPALSLEVPERVVLLSRLRTIYALNGKGSRLAVVALEHKAGHLLEVWAVPEGGRATRYDTYGAPGVWPIEREDFEVSAA